MTFFNPYYDPEDQSNWLEITDQLIDQHPLSLREIRSCVLEAWDSLWATTVGTGKASLPLESLNPPSTVVGYFFECLLARKLESLSPGEWRQGSGSEKDLHYIPDERFSIEVKTSGQLGLKIYGNRSYGQKTQDPSKEKKEKSGYYLTVNFYKTTITLIRFGWIDDNDWKPQSASSGQMASLPDEVYKGKLRPIPGEYILQGPIQLVDGVGEQIAQELGEIGIHTIEDLLETQKNGRHINAAKKSAEIYQQKIYKNSI